MKGKNTFKTIGPLSQAIWILDSRITNHITPFPKLINSYVKITREKHITITNGDSVPICGFGNITLESSIMLKNVLYVSQLSLYKNIKDFNLFNNFFLFFIVYFKISPLGKQF